eukprot:8573491-Alexandrium_andersonii.AAC.1
MDCASMTIKCDSCQPSPHHVAPCADEAAHARLPSLSFPHVGRYPSSNQRSLSPRAMLPTPAQGMRGKGGAGAAGRWHSPRGVVDRSDPDGQ